MFFELFIISGTEIDPQSIVIVQLILHQIQELLVLAFLLEVLIQLLVVSVWKITSQNMEK